jgi:hypothetical protein
LEKKWAEEKKAKQKKSAKETAVTDEAILATIASFAETLDLTQTEKILVKLTNAPMGKTA